MDQPNQVEGWGGGGWRRKEGLNETHLDQWCSFCVHHTVFAVPLLVFIPFYMDNVSEIFRAWLIIPADYSHLACKISMRNVRDCREDTIERNVFYFSWKCSFCITLTLSRTVTLR